MAAQRVTLRLGDTKDVVAKLVMDEVPAVGDYLHIVGVEGVTRYAVLQRIWMLDHRGDGDPKSTHVGLLVELRGEFN